MNRLKELRNQRKLTLDDIEAKTGIKRGTYSNYENNKTEPKLATWQKLADFFEVPVTYLQGLTYSRDEIIEIVNYTYIDGAFGGTSPIPGGIDEELYDVVNEFIALTSDDKLPLELYKKDEKNFNLTDKVKEFWMHNFGKLFNSNALSSFIKSQESEDDIAEFFLGSVKSMLSIVRQKYYLTKFGELYQSKYSTCEKDLHKKFIDKIKYLDLNSAREAVNQYLDLIEKIKADVENYKTDSLAKNDKEKYINEYFSQHFYSDWGNVYDKDPERYEIGVKIAERVDKGDTKLRDFLIVNDNKDFIAAYRDYKKENGEETNKLDHYFKNESKEYLERNDIHL